MRTFGMISSPPDKRDYTLDKVVAYAATPLRSHTVSHIPEPVDQGPYGVCAAVTLAGILEMVEEVQRDVPIHLSVKYLYGNRGPTDFTGEGMVPRELLRMASRFGTPRYELLPGMDYYPGSKAAITTAIDGEGIPNRPKGYVRLRTVQEIFDYMLKFDVPVFFGMWVTDSFVSTPGNGIVPPPSGNLLGGHAMRCIGIKQINGRWYLVVQNSWGEGWGDQGVGYICLEDGHRGFEAWGVIPETSDTLVKRPQTLLLRLGSKTMMVDDKPVQMDVAPFAQNNRTWVPLRFVTEALGLKVEWYPEGQWIILRDGGEQEGL